jgi:hypothetical protein
VLALQNGETLGYEGLPSGGMARSRRASPACPRRTFCAIAEYLLSLE